MIPYQPFSDHLQKFGVIATPTELHANASGMLTMNQTLPASDWITAAVDDFCIDEPIDPNLTTVLSALYDFAKEKLQSEDFSFQLLLPADAEPLIERLQALANWSGSYLSSLALAGLSNTKALSEDAQGFIADMEKIARVDDQVEGTVGEESDFMELTEYVRAGVMMLYLEIARQAPVSETLQ
ncbi:UPF0149 family protein [Marinicella sp. W31]|uniref:UPF0149 family protein n=1 Tax=Marinicella sp. W31 TaxID=3023713 RepID=UPI0037584D72